MNTNKNILQYESFNSINNCRICFENVDNVVSYCNCKNELAMIHHDCLKKWILLNIKENKESKFSCEICKFEYKLDIKKTKYYYLWYFLILLIISILFICYIYIKNINSHGNKLKKSLKIFSGLIVIIYYVKFLNYIFQKEKFKIQKILPVNKNQNNNQNNSINSNQDEYKPLL